ncbi:MAG TPA: SDR family oxidoreductase [Vicinamibacterales bacterium]|nr:SDR family oxidoreductase [Vicinamibacterales bacterium]
MRPRLKRVGEQIIVITGASSGIGMTTAGAAAARGASVVLAARSVSELNHITERINQRGGHAFAVACDVTRPGDVEQLAASAVAKFGRIDTWINNAGVGAYGRLLDQPIADKRELFDVDFWSVVYGCRAAVAQLRESGGVIINIGSQVSGRAAPLLGIYSAAKHAVKAYTDALRMELEHDRIPVWLTLVMPGPIDTPFPQHAVNYLAHEPQHVPPVYPPEEVARTILRCAERPVRDIMVGGVPKVQALLAAIAPRLTDLMMERQMISGMESRRPRESSDSLRRPSGEDYGQRHGRHPQAGFARSAYTRAALHDVGRAVAFIAVAAGAAAAVSAVRR